MTNCQAYFIVLYLFLQMAYIAKRCLILWICIAPMVTIAQKPFTIKGFGKGFKNDDKIYLLYKEPGAATSTADSTSIVNGAFI